MTEISHIQIKEAIKRVGEKGLQYSTQNRMRIMLQDMFDKAMIDEFVMKNPARGLHLRKPDIERRTLSVEEQEVFFDCAKGGFYYNFYVVAVNTGLRIGELAAFTWDDIDFESGYININKTLIYQKLEGDAGKTFHLGDPKTEQSKRLVPINNQCRSALQRQRRQVKIAYGRGAKVGIKQEFENLVFTTKFGTPLNTQIVIDNISKIVNEINLMRDDVDQFERFTPHCLRRTFATRCFEAGINPRTIQAYLGHSTLEMTMQTYTVVFSDFGKAELEKLEELNDKVVNNDKIVDLEVFKDGVKMAYGVK